MSIGAEIGAAAASSAMSSILPIVQMSRDKRWRDEDIARADALNAKTWEREDNAVQRRVADLKASGINPLLAAGSAANASSPTFSSRSPQSVSGMVDPVMARENIATSRKQRELIQAQIDGQYGMLNVAQQDADTRASAQSVGAGQLALNQLIEERNKLLSVKSMAKTDSDIALIDKQMEKIDNDIGIASGIYDHNIEYADRSASPYGSQPTPFGAAGSAGLLRGRVRFGEWIKNAVTGAWEQLGNMRDNADSITPPPPGATPEEEAEYARVKKYAREFRKSRRIYQSPYKPRGAR